MGSEQNRFPQQQRQELRKRWGGCWGAFSCFGSQKGGKRIVPASRLPDGSAAVPQRNGPQAGGLPNGHNQGQTLAPSIFAPPSSPASFTHSALPSTAQSPNNFLSLSANSPGGPSSTMFATGPYAHETQLVSPPVFSTFTTEPSTAPFTPPPELAHLTTPSSPDVPFAQFLTSSKDLKGADKTNYMASNDLHSAYSLYPGSPASSLISPISRASGDGLSSSFPERDFPPNWDPAASPQSDKSSRTGSGRLYGHSGNGPTRGSHDTNFFCPATFAEFYLDHNPPFPHTGGRLSVSKDSDIVYTSNQSRQVQNKSPKQDPDEIEAYRASFGFSADEIITTPQYVEIANVAAEDSFTMRPFTSNNNPPLEEEECRGHSLVGAGEKAEKQPVSLVSSKSLDSVPPSNDDHKDLKPWRQPGKVSGSSTPGIHVQTEDEEEDVFSKMKSSRNSRRYHLESSMSDAEIEYRRGRSLREGKGRSTWNC
ncbi:uncharacterized protein At1g76660-like [Punica granatum]|uniref:Uncharacterized protein At1g76660-like n=2 Tax=Punica granatum TaxID=22663 RepID=A0A6P8EEY8_PUNGR|nr:uncharacterized protein At1g76660-like [Punica granatum]XP_031403967.1 uncharacterized protein At1g76660-like [Punica granatum]OWM85968.1 hypothetical protein CDL15_Pgr012218 [Punica granatum]PKI35733.1 hypothetical protein CRG98_043891 [Punica granatum]